MPEKKPKPLQVELPNNIEPTYANFALVSHTASEIVLDMAQMLPNQPKIRVKSRIVMTPLNAKLFLRALQDNIAKYELKNGEIQLPGKSNDLVQQFFGGVKPPDSES